MSCANLAEAIKLAERFVRLRTVLMSFRLSVDGDFAIVEASANHPVGILRQFVFESLLLSLARAGSFIRATAYRQAKFILTFLSPVIMPRLKIAYRQFSLIEPPINYVFPVNF